MDYIAHYEKSPRMWSQGLHAHDDYEIYLHLNGGRFYCVCRGWIRRGSLQ